MIGNLLGDIITRVFDLSDNRQSKSGNILYLHRCRAKLQIIQENLGRPSFSLGLAFKGSKQPLITISLKDIR